MFRNILVAIDSSPSSARALQHAVALAHALHARLTLISVAPDVPAFAYRAGIDIGALERQAEHEAAELLRAAAASMRATCPS